MTRPDDHTAVAGVRHARGGTPVEYVGESDHGEGTVNQAAHDYYAALQRDYDTMIRQLVPRYDEMVECAVGLLAHSAPLSVLDIGTGTGTVTKRIASRVPDAHITGVDASPAMVQDATDRLAGVAERVTVLHCDIEDFAPDHTFDAGFSNLVLHNVPTTTKTDLLRNLSSWLHPRAVLVWGDLIRFDAPELQQSAVSARCAFALAAGCDPAFVEENFRKESADDHPLSVDAMRVMALAGGFASADVVWARDGFVVLYLRNGGTSP